MNCWHCGGEVIWGGDFDYEDYGIDREGIVSNLSFDQLILEYYEEGEPNSGWVHCSYTNDANRGEVLIFDGKNYRRGVL